MSVKLRLRRLGRTHSPFYHIVAADSRSPRDGKYIEQIGSYDPVAQPHKVVLDHEKAMKWLKNGAQPTETVKSLLSHEGVMLKLHLHRKKKSEQEIESGFQAWKASKVRKLEGAALKLENAKKADKEARMAAERAKRAAIAEKVAAKQKPAEEAAPAAAAEEAAPAENA
jgi:small subunit ribosomal protein S16